MFFSEAPVLFGNWEIRLQNHFNIFFHSLTATPPSNSITLKMKLSSKRLTIKYYFSGYNGWHRIIKTAFRMRSFKELIFRA